jgi:3-oxoacyl-[acyl-carrier protein] reductase
VLEFENQTALVTGSSQGIGAAIAIRLAEGGCGIMLHYRSARDEAESVAGRIRELGRRVEIFQADLSEPDAPDTLTRATLDAFGSVSILVNNAGITCDNLLVNLTPEEIERVLRTNLMGPILCTRSVAMPMMRKRYGRIVNITSSAASKPGRGQSNYAAAKGGLESFTKAMAVELAPRNILVNAVAPGVILTGMTERIRTHGHDEIMSRQLIKRYAEPEEVADAVAFLASPRNRHITGEVFHLDGGLKMD